MEESGGKENENQIGTLVNEITVMIGNPERSKSSPECYINRVPDYLCKVNKEAYTPRIISIGPIHHSTLKLQPMEKYKERFLKTEEEEEAEADEENWMASMVIRDLLLLENQLPFFVLETLYNIAFPDRSPSLIELTFECFKSFNIENMTPDNLRTKIKHFTHLLKTFQLNPPKKLPERKEGPPKLLYSATQLNEAGVKFRKSSRKSLLGIHFDSKRGVLEIPCLTLDDSTEILIRNIIALEQSQGKGYVTDYFAVLDFLIDTAKDIDLLCNEEIVVNYLGDSNAATSVVNKLNTDVIWYDTNSEYLRICEDLNDFYRIPWHRWKATLTHQYFSTPWKAASTIAAIILLVLTLIQSVISIIQVA
ncbi:upf0481 protein [Quercus suber]|uniref:Upf0481 protein n=1 Tax=Quercus suber TaxID=58331 RepID=A0AAW0M0R1_QUESU